MRRFVLSVLLLTYLLLLVFLLLTNVTTDFSSFATSLAGRSRAQINNISKGAELLNGVFIPPGKTFSFLATVPVSIEEGFAMAPAIVANRIQNEIGGGVCQLSSTLYNAALRGGVEIVERHPHIFPPLSVPPGFDATVAKGIYDLKLRNPYKEPIALQAKVSGDALVVSLKRGIIGKFFSKPAIKTNFSSRIRNLSSHLEVEVWKTVVIVGEEKRFLLSRDLYRIDKKR